MALLISAYKLISDVIDTKKVSKEEILDKLDVFLLANRITKEEYQELINKINVVYV